MADDFFLGGVWAWVTIIEAAPGLRQYRLGTIVTLASLKDIIFHGKVSLPDELRDFGL